MPLTIAHPIIVAPLWYGSRKWLDLPALVVGSMMPDIKYFLHLRTMPNIGHTHFGIVTQGIPAGLCILLIFTLLLLRPMRALSPGGVGRILPANYSFWTIQRFVVVVLSLYLGAWSHVFWDSFTHDGWFFVRTFPVLDAQVGPLPVYKYLQYSSGIFGTLAVIAWAVTTARHRTDATEKIANRTVPIAIILTVVLITSYVALGKNNPLTPYIVIIQTTIGVISGTFLGLLAFGIIDKIRPFRRNPTKV